MNECWLGIDLGTSSLKALCVFADGTVRKARRGYDSLTPEGWYAALAGAVRELGTEHVQAVGLSSQVGTYIVNGNSVLHWNEGIGREELDALKAEYGRDVFLREIGMPHPEIISYPVPRLMHIARHFGAGVGVMQPKDFLGYRLTGNLATDVWSWRGLANAKTGEYSALFLEKTGRPKLPPLMGATELLGKITRRASGDTGLAEGTPVYTGFNDFFASLIGMGLHAPGVLFDITGTSEHIGMLTADLAADSPMVAGPFVRDFVHYGGTASSGDSLLFGDRNFGAAEIPDKETIRKAPVFLPYLSGERAPVFDSGARGVFFGLEADTNRAALAYAVREGVVFSLYHIYEAMGKPAADTMLVSGGASRDDVLNRLKAELFGVRIRKPLETETSAMGAAMAAAVGRGAFTDLRAAADALCAAEDAAEPRGDLTELLQKRFGLYRELFPQLKASFQKLREVRK